MSVADGIAQPRSAPSPPPRLNSTKSSAGTAMPPTAAATGSAARRGSRRSPATNSRLSSRPGDEEEDRQQPVGGPGAERQVQVQRRRADPGVAQGLVGRRPRGVGPDEGDRRRRPAAGRRRRSPCGGPRRCGCVSVQEPRPKRRVEVLVTGRLRGRGRVGRCRPDFPAHRGRALPGEQLPDPRREARVAARGRRPACARWRRRRTPESSQTASAACRSATVPGVTAVGQPSSAARSNSRAIVVPGRIPVSSGGVCSVPSGGPDDGRRRALEQLALERGEDDVVGAVRRARAAARPC